MDELSNLVFDIKEKITDAEFKDIMEKLRDVKVDTRLPFEITYIKTKLRQDEDRDELEVKPLILKGYGMMNESDEAMIKNEIETDGVARVRHNFFRKMMGYKNDCCCHSFHSQVHLRVLDECDVNVDYNIYSVMITKIKQITE